MKIAAISELKAHFARYLRLVKSGETIEIQERGVPVAHLSGLRKNSKSFIIPPRKDPSLLAKMIFSVKIKKKFDIVSLLMEERNKS